MFEVFAHSHNGYEIGYFLLCDCPFSPDRLQTAIDQRDCIACRAFGPGGSDFAYHLFRDERAGRGLRICAGAALRAAQVMWRLPLGFYQPLREGAPAVRLSNIVHRFPTERDGRQGRRALLQRYFGP